jgi:hypothetical protein
MIDPPGGIEDPGEPGTHRVVIGHVDLEQLHRHPGVIGHAAQLVGLRDRTHRARSPGDPFAARWMAVARPMPELAPVTTVTGRSREWSGSVLFDWMRRQGDAQRRHGGEPGTEPDLRSARMIAAG